MPAQTRWLLVFPVALATIVGPIRAQSVAKQVGADIKNGTLDMLDIWTSPFHARARDWGAAAGVVGLAAAVSVLDDDVDRWAVHNEHASEFSVLKELRRGGLIYGGNKIMPYVAATYVFGVATNNQKIRDGVFGCASSYASQSLVRTQVIYRIVARRRPDGRDRGSTLPEPPGASNGDQYDFGLPGTNNWSEHSMPGGHVANVMACATFLSQRFHLGYVEPALFAVAAGVGVGRVLDRGHWASDQLLGTALGYAVGRQVAKRSLARSQNGGSLSPPRLSFSIIPEGDRTMLAWTGVF